MSLKKSVIIVAGGRGLRMGKDIPKQFIAIGGRPILMHTIESFTRRYPDIRVVVVLPDDQFDYWKALCRDYNFTIEYQLAAGGETRYHSVKNGLKHIGNADLVAVHDGVRPFASRETIERCFRAALGNGAAIPVMEVVESLREIDEDGAKSRRVIRSNYRTVQTPQVFRTAIIRNAYELPFSNEFTDDASVVEAAGYNITLVDGNPENIKITSPFDLIIAEAVLSGIAEKHKPH
ncbi:2-C-methyl-D-erythritol 4-phosphate cytidylyltransferase [Anaerophaga thermohalophila]|uniref:2-C-methyl-D-erythritol 4-phosphate cytidylyltransferase n=1 Tax=Anaerophaga thermohalophila TaxID=177400 RepID=UPI000237D3FE|nr:2-C-methyl-D-erythritol 4-phosphate cytidylyltransferase [Anaerophaga thermohalophila]